MKNYVKLNKQKVSGYEVIDKKTKVRVNGEKFEIYRETLDKITDLITND
jgi:hypothetical protein